MVQKNFVNGFQNLIPDKNDSRYKRILAIGDIHGNFQRLMSLWKKINVTDDDLVIFLGDYVDRGAEVEKVLQWTMNLKNQKNIIFLRGNHEQMMIDSIKNPQDSVTWICNGGQQTIKALKKFVEADENAMTKIFNFMQKLPLAYKIKIGGRDYFFLPRGH